MDEKNITGANIVSGDHATIIASQTIGLSVEFVRDLLAAKDKQIEALLNIIQNLKTNTGQ